MPRSYFDQLSQVRASASFGAVSSVHTEGVAQAQTHLEGDLNVLRTLVKDLHGKTNWYDLADMKLSDVSGKRFLVCESPSGFVDVATGTGTSTTAFDTAIKGITGHNDGLGSSTVDGVVVNSVKAYCIGVRDHDTWDPIDDGSGHEVYGHLTHSATIVETGDSSNQLSGYENITGVLDTNTGAGKKLWISVVDDTGGYFHVELFKDAARTLLVGHTATYNATGSQALTADNASGIGGTITVDAVGPASTGIDIRFGTYTVSWYVMIAGTETAYNFTTSKDVDMAAVLVSKQFKDQPWDRFIDPSWHDMAGITGTITDDNVTVDGMLYLLNGLVTQAQVNAKVDLLGHKDTSGDGADLVAIDDTASGTNGYFTGEYVQPVLEELAAQIGGTTSTAYDFTGGTGSLLADNDAIYAALNKLDQGWVSLIATTLGDGASLVGINDAGGFTTETTVEGALQEIYQKILNVAPIKVETTTSGVTPPDTNYTLPGSLSYTPDVGGNGQNLDVYYQGQLLTEGASDDYSEVAGSPSTQIQFHFTVPSGRNLTFVARQ